MATFNYNGKQLDTSTLSNQYRCFFIGYFKHKLEAGYNQLEKAHKAGDEEMVKKTEKGIEYVEKLLNELQTI